MDLNLPSGVRISRCGSMGEFDLALVAGIQAIRALHMLHSTWLSTRLLDSGSISIHFRQVSWLCHMSWARHSEDSVVVGACTDWTIFHLGWKLQTLALLNVLPSHPRLEVLPWTCWWWRECPFWSFFFWVAGSTSCTVFSLSSFVLWDLGTWVVTSNHSLACISRMRVHHWKELHFRQLVLSWPNHQLGLRWIRLVDRCREWYLEILRSSTLEVFWSSTWLTSGCEMTLGFTWNSWNTFLTTNDVRFEHVVQSLIHDSNQSWVMVQSGEIFSYPIRCQWNYYPIRDFWAGDYINRVADRTVSFVELKGGREDDVLHEFWPDKGFDEEPCRCGLVWLCTFLMTFSGIEHLVTIVWVVRVMRWLLDGFGRNVLNGEVWFWSWWRRTMGI